ncbi:hypothetical protein BCBMB205_05190 [Bacillus sp. CN2]|nr:hypothetical protein BCBMB205_05190 [Bacillus velezensis]ARZ56844.1 hypothetical protein BAGQ_0582 [Bacillus velezensis]GFR56459.1 hypothetical protein BCBMB205_05190 [Bacillus sp. CN2]
MDLHGLIIRWAFDKVKAYYRPAFQALKLSITPNNRAI